MEARDRLSDQEWEQAWGPLIDSLVVPIAKLMDKGVLPPRRSEVGVYAAEDGKRYIVAGMRKAYEAGYERWLRSVIWSGLAYGGIRASDYLPANAEAVQKGLWVACCAKCSYSMWAEPPQGGKPGARHCAVCLADAEREKKRRQRGTDLSERPCACCGSVFTPKRTDARCCSAKCRAKLSRQAAKS